MMMMKPCDGISSLLVSKFGTVKHPVDSVYMHIAQTHVYGWHLICWTSFGESFL